MKVHVRYSSPCGGGLSITGAVISIRMFLNRAGSLVTANGSVASGAEAHPVAARKTANMSNRFAFVRRAILFMWKIIGEGPSSVNLKPKGVRAQGP
jgi:hypothetical protein